MAIPYLCQQKPSEGYWLPPLPDYNKFPLSCSVREGAVWRQDFYPCSEVTSIPHSVSGGLMESNTSLPSLSSQRGVHAGLVGSLNSCACSAITRNSIPTLGCQWKQTREPAFPPPHDNKTSSFFVHRHVRGDWLHHKIFKRSVVSLHNTQDVQGTI